MMDHCAALQARIRALEAEIEQLSVDPAYGVLTRAGVDRRWREVGPGASAAPLAVVFTDLDHFKALNTTYGYEEMNRRVAAAMFGLRVRDSDLIGGRWFSGDELVFIVAAADAAGMADRVQRAFAAQGISATIGIALITTSDLAASVAVAAALVQQAKAAGQRSSVNEVA